MLDNCFLKYFYRHIQYLSSGHCSDFFGVLVVVNIYLYY